MTSIRAVALGIAVAEADHRVREIGGENAGPRVRRYLELAGIHVAAPWCAAWVHFLAHLASDTLGVRNPLDAVVHEALVQSYHEWAAPDLVVAPDLVEPGDLVLYSFGGSRWDHIGIVRTPPGPAASFTSIEGNTNKAGSRDGDGVYVKGRRVGPGYGVEFVRWAP